MVHTMPNRLGTRKFGKDTLSGLSFQMYDALTHNEYK